MVTKDELYKQTEEFFNTITHGIGAVFSLAILILMIYLSYDHTTLEIFSLTVYGISLVFLSTCSTGYHAAKCRKLETKFHILDQMAICVVIIVIYARFMLLSVKGDIGWNIFGAVWSIAETGNIFKIFFTG